MVKLKKKVLFANKIEKKVSMPFIDTDERRAKPLSMIAGNQSFCLLTYYHL